jgi:tetratricopeptide (TPR) repeat protein
MKKVVFSLLIITLAVQVHGQQTVEQLREKAIAFQRQQDFSNTLMVLGKALEIAPTNLTLLKDVAFTFYLGGDYKRAEERILPLTERDDADVQVFQIAGNIYRGLDLSKQCERIYKEGLKKYPTSGQLFSEYGELMWDLQKPEEAIKLWEMGINLDPSQSGNYYHAAKFYFAAQDVARSLIYGEQFINLESYSVRTAEVKILLVESYKRAFTKGIEKQHFVKPATTFETKFLSILQKQSDLAARGITTETLLILRSRFIFDWFNNGGEKFPHVLFDQLQSFMRNGLFESYNQWVFGPASDPSAYQNWLRIHQSEYSNFQQYQRSNIFRQPANQHYF